MIKFVAGSLTWAVHLCDWKKYSRRARRVSKKQPIPSRKLGQLRDTSRLAFCRLPKKLLNKVTSASALASRIARLLKTSSRFLQVTERMPARRRPQVALPDRL